MDLLETGHKYGFELSGRYCEDEKGNVVEGDFQNPKREKFS